MELRLPCFWNNQKTLDFEQEKSKQLLLVNFIAQFFCQFPGILFRQLQVIFIMNIYLSIVRPLVGVGVAMVIEVFTNSNFGQASALSLSS